MSVVLYYAVAGTLEIHLDGLRFQEDIKWPQQNVKGFHRKEQHLQLQSTNLGHHTDWGAVRLIDISGNEGSIEFIIDTHEWGTAECWYYFVVNGVKKTHPISFKSGIRGPIGDPRRTRTISQTEAIS